MKRVFFKIGLYISVVGLLLLVGCLAFTSFCDANQHLESRYIPVSGDVKMSATTRFGGVILIFNQGMPYTGSLIGGSITGWHRFGVGCTKITDPGTKDEWWTFVVDLWYPVLIFGFLPFVAWRRKRHAKFRDKSDRARQST